MIRHDKLNAYIESARPRPFDWATWNCCHYVGGWVHDLTGQDVLAMFPPWDSEASARAIIDERGGLVSAVSAVLPQIHLSRAAKGDVVLGSHDNGAALGICLGRDTAYVGTNGLIFLPTLKGLKAWRVE